MEACLVQVPQRVTRRGRSVHDDRAESVLDRRFEAALTAGVDLDHVGKGPEHTCHAGQVLDAGSRPRLVERGLQRLGPGPERVRTVCRRPRPGLALLRAAASSSFGREEPFVLGTESLAFDPPLRRGDRKLGQEDLVLFTHTLDARESFGETSHRLARR